MTDASGTLALPSLLIDRDARIKLTIQELIGKSINIVGLKRSGKTNTGEVIAEEWLNHDLPLTIIDRQNEWWGLAEAYPFIIAGRGRRATIPLDLAHAADLAAFSFTRKISVILSLLKYEDEEQWAILQAYFERLLELAEEAFDEERPQPYGIVLEEARTYLPLAEKTPVKRVLKEIILGGGKLGLTTVLLNQRLAGADTDCASQADLYFLHRVAHPRDRMIYKEIIPLPPKEVDRIINGLATGEAIVVNGGRVATATIRQQTTYHAGATPRFQAPIQKAQRGTLDQESHAQAYTLMTSDLPEHQVQPVERSTHLAGCSPLVRSESNPWPSAGRLPFDIRLSLSQPDLVFSMRKVLPMLSLISNSASLQTGSGALPDLDGSSHTITCGDQALQLDGAAATIVAVDQHHVTISGAGATIVVTTTNFWSAIVGEEDATREDGGMLLAQNIARWAALQEQRALVQRWIELGQGLEILCLPAPRLDALTLALLEAAASDHSEEGQRAIAYILQKRLSNGRAAEVLQRAGLLQAMLDGAQERATAGSSNGNNRTPHKRQQAAPRNTKAARREDKATDEQFAWDESMMADLEREYLASTAASISEAAAEIAARYGWPKKSVAYKIYYMRLPKKKQEALKKAGSADREASLSVPEEREMDPAEGGQPTLASTF